MDSSENSSLTVKKTVHDKKIIQEKITEEQWSLLPNEHDVQIKDNEISEGIIPKETANVTQKKSKGWNLFNKPETTEAEAEIVKSYPFQMSEIFLQSITVTTKLINTLKSYKKTDNIIKNLRSSIVMIEGLAEKTNSELPNDNIMDKFSTTVRIVTCMIGKAIMSMHEAYHEIKNKFKNVDSSFLDDFQLEIYKYLRMSNRIAAVAAESRSNEVYRTWGDIFEESIKEKTVDISSKKITQKGNVMSDVTVIGEGDDQLFYKDDIKVISRDRILSEAIKKYSMNQPKKIKRFLERDFAKLYTEYYEKYKKFCQRNNSKETFINYIYWDETVYRLDFEVQESFFAVCKEVSKMRAVTYNAENTGIAVGEGFVGRNIAVTKMAQLLGIEDIVVKSQTVKITSGDSEKRGFVMSKATGMDFAGINTAYKDSENIYTGEFQRQLVLLQIFDNIMGQRDRHLNNIFYQTEVKDGKCYFTGVTGIDNDMCAGLNAFLSANVGNVVGVLDKSGKYLAFDCMDKDLYEHMKVLTEETIRTTLTGLISEPYIEAILYRFSIIMNAVNNTVNKKNALVERNKWGENTYERLCKYEGKRHTNYFHKFVDYRNKKQSKDNR